MGVVAEWDEPPSKDKCQKVGIVDFANIGFRCAKKESKAFLQRVLGTIRSIAALQAPGFHDDGIRDTGGTSFLSKNGTPSDKSIYIMNRHSSSEPNQLI